MTNQYGTERATRFSFTQFIIRFVAAVVVLGITAALTPGFSIAGIWPLLIGALVLSGLSYVASNFLGMKASPFGKGITGFLLAAAIIYLTQFFVVGFAVTFWGALIGAVIYGVVDAVVPGKAM